MITDVIVRVNDVDIDSYEMFMFIIPNVNRPVTIRFIRVEKAVSRLVERVGNSPPVSKKQVSNNNSTTRSSLQKDIEPSKFRDQDPQVINIKKITKRPILNYCYFDEK